MKKDKIKKIIKKIKFRFPALFWREFLDALKDGKWQTAEDLTESLRERFFSPEEHENEGFQKSMILGAMSMNKWANFMDMVNEGIIETKVVTSRSSCADNDDLDSAFKNDVFIRRVDNGCDSDD